MKLMCLLLMVAVYTVFAGETYANSNDKPESGTNMQQNVVTGTVVDSQTGEPIPGANIVVKGTTTGAITDGSGKYSISVPSGATLVFSFIGYESQEVVVGNRSSINISLVSSLTQMDEVVVVGYGTQKKMSVTGAVATVQDVQLRVMPEANLGSRLQGRVSGVTIINDASPGGNPYIRIRGYGSVNNNDPLYVVDGVPLVGGLDNIDPNNIASISILKDASSSAIYGSRASNGVVIISTKKGSSGTSQATFNFRYGVQNWKDDIALLSPQESADLQWLQYKNDGYKPGDVQWGNTTYGYGAEPRLPDYYLPSGKMFGEVDESLYSWPTPYYGIAYANKEGTDWFSEIRNPNAPTAEYNLGLSGGSDKGTYAFSAGWIDQEGSVDYTWYKRATFGLNSDVKLTDWLKVGESIQFAYSQRVGFTNENDLNPIAMAERTSKLSPVYDIKGNWVTGWQPASLLYRAKDDVTKRLRTIGNGFIEIKPLKSLTLKSLIGFEYNDNNGTDFVLRQFESQDVEAADRLAISHSGNLQYNWANTLNYNVTVADAHNINVLLGTEMVNFRSDYLSGGRSTYAFTDPNYMILDSGEKDQVNGGGFDEWFTFSYFGRLNYDFRGKYLVEAVIRRDGSSRFVGDNRWGTFPAASIGWRISDESFMKDNVAFINSLKIRAGYGENGNDNVGNYNAYSTFRLNGNESFYNIQGASPTSSVGGFHQYRLGNPMARWESSATADIGFDAIMFNNKFEINFDLYSRTTTDMLFPDPKPSVYGMLVFPSSNVGEVSNKGFDLTLTYHGKIGNDLNFNVTAIGSHYKNEIIKLNNNPKEILYGPQLRTQVFTASYQGVPLSSFYGYIVDGIFNTQEEVNAWPKYNPSVAGVDSYSKPGRLKYRDVNGDGIINANDRTVTGNPHPKLISAINLDFQYKDFDLSIFTKGVYGVDILNFRRWGLFSGISIKDDLYKSWTTERYANGEEINCPIITRDNVELHQPSSFFLENGSYFRVSSVILGYSLPKQLLSSINVKGVRFYIQATNPLTFTKYTGLDPELPNTDNLLGVDNSTYPVQKSWIFGIDLKF